MLAKSQSHRYVGLFEDAEWTGEKLLQVKSDEQIEKLGMYIETDRKYLLLQLSRVRDCTRTARRRLQADDSGIFPEPRSISVAVSMLIQAQFVVAASAMAGVTFATPRPIAHSTEYAQPAVIEMEPMLGAR